MRLYDLPEELFAECVRMIKAQVVESPKRRSAFLKVIDREDYFCQIEAVEVATHYLYRPHMHWSLLRINAFLLILNAAIAYCWTFWAAIPIPLFALLAWDRWVKLKSSRYVLATYLLGIHFLIYDIDGWAARYPVEAAYIRGHAARTIEPGCSDYLRFLDLPALQPE